MPMIFTAIVERRNARHPDQPGRTYRLIISAPEIDEAKQKTTTLFATGAHGLHKILSIGAGESGLEAHTGTEDETWVWDGEKWWAM